MIQVEGIFAGQGGAGLRLDIAFYSLLPASAINNQIAVITDVVPNKITFSYATPESPAGGDLWIHTVDNDGYTLPAYSADYGAEIKLIPGITMQFNGTIWEYRNAYIGISGEWKMFSTQSPLSELTWSQIIHISNSGEDASLFFAVGDEHELSYNNGASYLTAVIGDFYHNTITGASKKAPIAFTLKECIDTQVMNSTNTNTGSWRDSRMRNSSMPYYLNRFPAELIADGAIKYVDVVTSAGGKSTTLVTTSDRLRLHSSIELGLFNTSLAASGEGSLYAYYASGNRIKTYGGGAINYWERTPHIGNTTHFCGASYLGAASGYAASSSYGVAICFDL